MSACADDKTREVRSHIPASAAVAVTLRVPGGEAEAVVGTVALVLAEVDGVRAVAPETTL